MLDLRLEFQFIICKGLTNFNESRIIRFSIRFQPGWRGESNDDKEEGESDKAERHFDMGGKGGLTCLGGRPDKDGHGL